MEIMDDLLDVKDRLEDALANRARRARSALRGESGFSTLVLVLVIMAVGAIIITPILAFVVVGTKAGETHDRNTDRFYAADAGIQDGLWCVSSGDYADDRPGWKGTWDESVYSSDPLSYSVPAVNGCDVTVTIRPVWLLSGVEEPSATQQRTPNTGLSTVTSPLGGGKLQVVIIMDTALQSTTKIKRIGVWIPEGCQYTMGSSDLEKLDHGNAAYCVPTVSDWKNGHKIVFEYATPVSFTSLPNVTVKRMVLSFSYTGTASPTGAWSWCRANINSSTDYYLGWSADIKIFQVESSATDPATGVSTTVVAGQMTNESVGTYLAYYGDYSVTGNALLRDKDNNDFRETAYLSSPGEITGIPDSATARKVLLYWSGFKYYPQNVSSYSDAALLALADTYGVTQVSLKVKVGTTTWTAPDPIVAEDVQVLKGTLGGSPDGWVYSCSADITDLVKNQFGDEYVGNATYTIGHAELTESSTPLPSTQNMNGIWGTSESNIFMVGNSGAILKGDGTAWDLKTGPTPTSTYNQTLRGVWGSSATDLWAVGDRRSSSAHTIWHTTNGGTSWTAYSLSSAQNLNAIWGYNSSNIWAVGASGKILKYNGSSWSAQTGPTPTSTYNQTLRGVWGSSATDLWAVGDRLSSSAHTIWHTTNGGTSWTAYSLSSAQNLNAIWGYNSSNIWAVGASGRILKYNGTSWTAQTSGTTQTLYGVWGTSSTDVYAVGASGTILHTTNGGTNWTAMTSGCTTQLNGVWGTSSTSIYAAGNVDTSVSTLLHWDGTSWQRIHGPSTDTPLYGWVNGHTGETVAAYTDQPLGDPSTDTTMNWHISSCAWSIIVLYTSPVTLAHQMYLYDTLRFNDSGGHIQFDLDGFLAPASVATEADAVRLTCCVSEGDDTYNPENLFIKSGTKAWQQLYSGTSGPTEKDNLWNKESNSGGVTGYPPDCIDLDTFTVPAGYMSPADSSASIWIGDNGSVTTGSGSGMDAWNLVYMILSFRSDNVGSGCLTYVVL